MNQLPKASDNAITANPELFRNDGNICPQPGPFRASMIGIGAMIGAGIFVLTGIAAGEAGPGALLSFALNGLVTLL